MEIFFAVLFFVGVICLCLNRLDRDDVIDTRPREKIEKERSGAERTPPRQPQSVPHSTHPPKEAVEKPDRVISGKAYVTDGDGLRMKREEIRLFGVDAPEFRHPLGKKAKWALFQLTKGQTVRAEVTGQDDHGRTVARCFLADGRDLSAEMVKQGLALDWPKYSGGIYKQFEPEGVRKRLWLADARQKGRMHVWDAYETKRKRPQKVER